MERYDSEAKELGLKEAEIASPTQEGSREVSPLSPIEMQPSTGTKIDEESFFPEPKSSSSPVPGLR